MIRLSPGWLGALLLLFATSSACTSVKESALPGGSPDSTIEGGNMSMQIQSSAFANGEKIPKKYTCDGENVSPPLEWSGSPQDVRSLVLIVDDPDAPSGTFVHWLSYEIPADTTQIPEGGQVGIQGQNSFRKEGYGGPCPPKGPAHRYFFKIFALDSHLDLQKGATMKDVEAAMRAHVLAQGQMIGLYSR
jgi:Raf kinase inhibitor-like YbhB/YbcL family protein